MGRGAGKQSGGRGQDGRRPGEESQTQPEEDDDQPGSAREARGRRLRRWAVPSILSGILTAAVAESLSGGLTAGLRTAKSWVVEGEPVVVHSAVDLGRCDSAWMIPRGRPARTVPDPWVHSDEQVRAWARESGAVQAADTTVELTIRGESSAAVVLQELRARVLDRRPPLRGTRADPPPCGGNVRPRLYTADLDAARPVADARVLPGQDVPPVSFPYQVTHADPEVIRLTAYTEGCDCRWVLELVYVDGDQRRVLRIDDHGRPFRTTAVPEDGGERR